MPENTLQSDRTEAEIAIVDLIEARHLATTRLLGSTFPQASLPGDDEYMPTAEAHALDGDAREPSQRAAEKNWPPPSECPR